jgi:predicted DNA-binding transcriptional regulator AlpA
MSKEQSGETSVLARRTKVRRTKVSYEDTSEVARRTKTSESYWNKMRVAGDGPPYVKLGRKVRYRPSAVDTWMAGLTRRSTSDDPAQQHAGA